MITHFMIRLCQPDDARLLAPLIQALATEEGAEAPDLEALVAVITTMLQTGFSDFVIAEEGSEGGPVLGCIQINYRLSTWATASYAYVEDFYLKPAARGRGVGTKLLDYACQRAEGRGCEFIQLDVREGNKRAAKLYARYGFKVTGSMIWKKQFQAACDTDHTEDIHDLVAHLRGQNPAS